MTRRRLLVTVAGHVYTHVCAHTRRAAWPPHLHTFRVAPASLLVAAALLTLGTGV